MSPSYILEIPFFEYQFLLDDIGQWVEEERRRDEDRRRKEESERRRQESKYKTSTPKMPKYK